MIMIVFIAMAVLACSIAVGGRPIEPRSALVPCLNKSYILVSSDDKYDDILKEQGASLIQRKIAKLSKPVIKLTEKNNIYTLTSQSAFKHTVDFFKLGEDFTKETSDGRRVTSVFTQDGNKLIETQSGDETTTIIREFTPEEVLVTVEFNGIRSHRTYKVI